MTTTIYQNCKQQLKEVAADAKKSYPDDKPAQRQIINDHADTLIRGFWGRTGSDKQKQQYQNWLSLYACKLHPKN